MEPTAENLNNKEKKMFLNTIFCFEGLIRTNLTLYNKQGL